MLTIDLGPAQAQACVACRHAGLGEHAAQTEMTHVQTSGHGPGQCMTQHMHVAKVTRHLWHTMD